MSDPLEFHPINPLDPGLEPVMPEFGAETGDHRENDPRSAGFTPDDDRVFRSHFQRANRLADRSYEQVRAAYAAGQGAAQDPRNAGRPFDDVERELSAEWLNVRTAAGDWATVRDFAREGYERGVSLGFARDVPEAGTTPSHQRPSFRDPAPGDIDPTDPQSPEQTLEWQHQRTGDDSAPFSGDGPVAKDIVGPRDDAPADAP